MGKWLRFGFHPCYAPDDGAAGGGAGGSGAAGNASAGEGAPSESGAGETPPSGGGKPAYPGWHDQLPVHLRGNEALGDMSRTDVVARYIELREKDGSTIAIPGEGATQDEIDAFHRKLGRPEAPGEYVLQKPADWPTNVPWNQGEAMQFAEISFAAGLTKDQAANVWSRLMTSAKKTLLAHSGATNDQLAAWNEELSASFKDKVEQALNTANRAAEQLGEPALLAKFKEAGLTRYPPLVRALNKIWSAIGPERIFSGAVDTDGKSRQAQLEARYPNTKF